MHWAQIWCQFIVLFCRHRSGEGVWLQWILGSSQRLVCSVWLHCHHEIWQCRRVWEWDTRGTVHQPSLPGTVKCCCFVFACQWIISRLKTLGYCIVRIQFQNLRLVRWTAFTLCLFSNALTPEVPKITRIQYWFSALAFCCHLHFTQRPSVL